MRCTLGKVVLNVAVFAVLCFCGHVVRSQWKMMWNMPRSFGASGLVGNCFHPIFVGHVHKARQNRSRKCIRAQPLLEDAHATVGCKHSTPSAGPLPDPSAGWQHSCFCARGERRDGR